jgi:hypothetical protein
MKKMTNIIVGCGGSGAKIAIGMAELMGQDPSWRHEMDENVYFMLLDTDRGDLESHAGRLRAAAPNIHVSSLLTTNGYQTVGEILDDLAPGVITGKPETDRIAMERFAEHWWFAEKNATDMPAARPFRAPKVSRITTGAGQVPMVSYIASWIAMKPSRRSPGSIETCILELCQKISERRVGINFDGDNPMGEFNIFFLGSLAGGTGRGALIPVAFKLKEVFYKRFGRIPFISGYLMDQSCFDRKREPHEALAQMINSMTGWSEVSAWISYYEEECGGKVAATNYGYSLPGLMNMHDRANDNLSSLLDIPEVASARKTQSENNYGLDRARLPFDAVGVIGRQSAANFEAQSVDQIYQMISTALYVRLSKSKIDSKISNEGRTYFSVGTAVTLVPYEQIETFFQRKASLDVVYRFETEAPADILNSHVEGLLKHLGLSDPLGDFLAYDATQEVPSPMQAFAQRCMEPSGFLENRMADLEAALRNQNPNEAERLIGDLLSESALENVEFVKETAQQFVESFCAHSIKTQGAEALKNEEELLESILGRVLGMLQETGSAKAVEQFCKTLSSKLQELRDSVLSRNGIEQWFAKAGMAQESAAASLEKTKKREGFLGLGVFFTDDEIAEVMAAAKSEMRVATLRMLGRALYLPPEQNVKGLGLMNRIKARLDDASSRAQFLCRCANVVKDRMNISLEGLADERRKLFASSNPFDDINDGADMNIRRAIRPLFPADEDMALDAEEATQFAASVIRGVDQSSGKIYYYASNDKIEPLDREDWLDQLKTGFQASRYKAIFPDGKHRSVMEKFRLAKVLRDLEVGWRKLLQSSWKSGDKDRYYAQAQRFRNFFGIDPKVVGETVEISGGEDFRATAGEDYLMLGLAAASARACRPFWRTSSNAEHTPHLIVQVPVSIEEGKQSRWAEFIQQHSNMPIQSREQIDVLSNATAGSEREHNPYVLAVYTSTAADSLDQVTTLDAWRNNSTLLKALRYAEDLDGKCPMPFNEEITQIWNGYRGSGFTDPSYIYRPELRRNRWRPWVSQEDQEKQAQQADGSRQAFLAVYACLGPKWYLKAALGEEQANAILAASGLPGDPIFTEGDKKMFKLGRLPHRIRAGMASTDEADIRIGMGSNVTQSIRTIPEVLAGKREARSGRGAGTEHLMELGKSVENEYNDFFGAFAEVHGFHPDSAKAAHLKMLQKLKAHFIEERQNSNPNQEESDRDFWQGVLVAVGKKITDLGG